MKMKLLLLALAALVAISNAYGQNRGVAYVDTLASLDAMRPIPGMTVYVRGGSVTNDWGDTPLPFSYVSGSTAATNRFCRAVTTGTGRWIYEWDGNIMAFSIAADGVTDDTAKTQEAINHSIFTGITLNLPSGYHTSIVDGIIITNTSNIQGPDSMLAMSSSIVANEQNKWIWKLKDNSTNGWILKYTNGQHVLKGVTLDGNKANQTVAMPLLFIDVGFASYRESTWEDIGAFNGKGDGIYNRAHSPTFYHVMSQNNDGNGIVITNGYDSAISHSYFGGNGGHGMAAFDHGSYRWVQNDSFQNRKHGVYLLNPYLGYFKNIVCNNNLQCGWYQESLPSTNNTTIPPMVTSGNLGEFTITESQFLNNNYPRDKQNLPSPEPSGTWSNFKEGGTATVSPYSIWSTRFYLSENTSLTNRVKNLIESVNSGFPNLSKASLVGCFITSNTNFFTAATPMSGNILSTASFIKLRDANLGIEYNTAPNGWASIGGASISTNPLTLGTTSGRMIRMDRTSLPQIADISVGFRSIILTESTANFANIATFENNGEPIWFLGSASAGSAPRNGTITAEPASSGTNTANKNLILRAGAGTGSGTGGGSINFQTPTTGTSGSTVQTLVTRLQVLPDGALFLRDAPQPGAATDGLFYRGVNSAYPGVTNWYFARTNGWVPLP